MNGISNNLDNLDDSTNNDLLDDIINSLLLPEETPILEDTLDEIDEEGAKIKEFDKMFHRSPTPPNNSYIEKNSTSKCRRRYTIHVPESTKMNPNRIKNNLNNRTNGNKRRNSEFSNRILIQDIPKRRMSICQKSLETIPGEDESFITQPNKSRFSLIDTSRHLQASCSTSQSTPPPPIKTSGNIPYELLIIEALESKQNNSMTFQELFTWFLTNISENEEAENESFVNKCHSELKLALQNSSKFKQIKNMWTLSPRNYLIDDGYGSSNTSNELSHQNNMPVESTWYSKSRSRRSSAFMNIDEIKKLAKLKRDEKEYMEFDSPPCGQRMTVYACSSIKQYEQRYGHLNDLDIIQNVAPNLVNLLQETGIEQQQEPIIEQTNEPQLLIPKKRRRSMVQIPSLSQIDPHELKENDENRLFKKLGFESNPTDIRVIPDMYRKYITLPHEGEQNNSLTTDSVATESDRDPDSCFYCGRSPPPIKIK